MKTQLRLRLLLPPLSGLHADSRVPFALLDRRLRLLRTGEQGLRELARGLPGGTRVEALLHGGDAVVAELTLPPVAGRHLAAAVQAQVESMTLSETSQLCIAHGPRQVDGRVTVAWGPRAPLARCWRLLDELGLRVAGFIPLPLVAPECAAHEPAVSAPDTVPNKNAAPGTAANAGTTAGQSTASDKVLVSALPHLDWTAAWPAWSLALPSLQPRSSAAAWRPALRWAVAAALIWVVGLMLHSWQLRGRADAVEAQMRVEFSRAFPDEPPPANALARARALVGRMRAAAGREVDDELMPLALAAAQSLPGLAGQVRKMEFAEDGLVLMMREDKPLAVDRKAMEQAFASRGLDYTLDAGPPQTWRLHRADKNTKAGGRK